jgi:hypothetical protein
MMKHHTTLATGLAAVLAVPVLTGGQEELGPLEDALAGTVRALEILGGMEERVSEAPDEVAGWIRTATETPHLEGRALDDRLTVLRREVSLLQMELDTLEDPGSAKDAATPGTTAPALTGPGASPLPRISTGLDASLRELLSREMTARTEPPASQGRAVSAGQEVARLAPRPEADGYSADVLGQARACYHAGRYEDGLVLLERRNDVRSLYWRARCLTRLERYDQAADVLKRIVELEGDSYEGRRAATDLEFVKWRKDFGANLPQGLKKPVSDR